MEDLLLLTSQCRCCGCASHSVFYLQITEVVLSFLLLGRGLYDGVKVPTQLTNGQLEVFKTFTGTCHNKQIVPHRPVYMCQRLLRSGTLFDSPSYNAISVLPAENLWYDRLQALTVVCIWQGRSSVGVA